ncbi:hypothetical protein OG897_39650 [Streptomyces sp. NBC_00237]|uniref:hypothetical protein n=1 Tax=Streptomyces sp. NBC_00237 TaxID=2975687 RepID=UPI00225279E8|nr:hypothetical protein [Streptomyces sp. NBC_00237]MCX5207506.1 hypothetical protein [Streptomyces sp. NBC_00237]
MTTNTDLETQVSEAGVRDVSDFLADLDDVLATSTAPTIPAPATEPDPEPDAAATMPDVALDLDMVGPDADTDKEPVAAEALAPAPVEAPAPAARPPALAKDWWNDVYKDDAADQDTFTGNAPAPAVAPPPPKHAPAAAPAQPVAEGDDADDEDGDDEDEAPEPKKTRTGRKKEQDAEDAEAGTDEAPEPATTGGRIVAAVKKAGPVVAGTANGGGLINNPRGRQTVFAGTAYAAGWGLHLDDWVTGLMAHADQYATPVAGCALGLGVLGLATRSKLGGVVFVSSLGLITALQMARPAWVVGGGVALGLQLAYRMVRGWVGHYGDKWPWKGVVWAAHVPAATATVAFLLYGTN